MQSSPISTSRYAFTVSLPPNTTRSPMRSDPSWHRMWVPAPIQTSRPISMCARPRRQEIPAPRDMCTTPAVTMWRFRTRRCHRARSRPTAFRARSPTLLLRVQQEVVEQPLWQGPVQVPLVQVVQPKVGAVREHPPSLPQQCRTDPRLHGPHRPPDQRRQQLLGLGPDVLEADLPGPPFDVARVERVEIHRELEFAQDAFVLGPRRGRGRLDQIWTDPCGELGRLRSGALGNARDAVAELRGLAGEEHRTA